MMDLSKYTYIVPACVGSALIGVASSSLLIAIGVYCCIVALRAKS